MGKGNKIKKEIQRNEDHMNNIKTMITDYCNKENISLVGHVAAIDNKHLKKGKHAALVAHIGVGNIKALKPLQMGLYATIGLQLEKELEE
ncbi:hypothetical protein WAF17_02305 [Bernardetia sp. ABR2-2B]|uniref:hypothetical protein n=1 Tax=Bernardetia sp. ABR2-2B TaxID=3127472 RepID=UPI0030D036AC